MPGPSSAKHLLERTIEPRPTANDSFRRVAQTIGSTILTGPVELGALWASLPYDLPKAWTHKWPTPLAFGRVLKFPMVANQALADVTGFTVDQLTADAIREVLEHYPTAQGWYFPEGGQPAGEPTSNGWKVRLAWTTSGTSINDQTAIDDQHAKLAEVAQEYRWRGRRWLRPAVGAHKDYLKPFSTWWLLLFGLSIVARYEPAEWAKALSINESDLAAPLESLLDEAMLAIPQLVLEALERQPFLVRK
jgi:hypothetical protein